MAYYIVADIWNDKTHEYEQGYYGYDTYSYFPAFYYNRRFSKIFENRNDAKEIFNKEKDFIRNIYKNPRIIKIEEVVVENLNEEII